MNGHNWDSIKERTAAWQHEPPQGVSEEAWAATCTICTEALARWERERLVPPPSLVEQSRRGVSCEWWIRRRAWRMSFHSPDTVSLVTVDGDRMLLNLRSQASSLSLLEKRFLEPVIKAAAMGVSNAPGDGTDAGEAPCVDA